MTTKTRFAPSPTGYLHVGNVRAALLNWLFARKTGGDFHSAHRRHGCRTIRPKAIVEAIRDDLTWLGLGWDATFRQSERQALYDAAAEKLRADGTALCLLRDAGGAGDQTQAAARPPASRRSMTARRSS